MKNTAYTENDISLIWVGESTGDFEHPYNAIKDMYDDYMDELSGFMDILPDAELKRPEGDPSSCCVLICIKGDDDFIPVGFLRHSAYGYGFSDHDITLLDLYIRKEFRRRGIGKSVTEIILKNAADRSFDITMFISENNHIAQSFFRKLSSKNGYVNCFDVGNIRAFKDGSDLEFYYWRRF